jgi:hypothetical protein
MHGPYFYRFQWHRGRMIKEYVRLSDVGDVREACARYRESQARLRASERGFREAMSMLRSRLKELKEYGL